MVIDSMKIINIRLKSIEARRYMSHHKQSSRINVNHNISLTHVHDIKEKQAVVDFQYTAGYGSIGMIKLGGSLIYEDDKAKNVANMWKKARKMPNHIANQIYSAIMHTCVIETVGIAKDLDLPSPIPLPQVKLGVKPKKGHIGPEVA